MLSVDQFLRLMALPAVLVALLVASEISASQVSALPGALRADPSQILAE